MGWLWETTSRCSLPIFESAFGPLAGSEEAKLPLFSYWYKGHPIELHTYVFVEHVVYHISSISVYLVSLVPWPRSEEKICHIAGITWAILVRNSGFVLHIIADLRADLKLFSGQTYEGASGGLLIFWSEICSFIEPLTHCFQDMSPCSIDTCEQILVVNLDSWVTLQCFAQPSMLWK